MPSLSIRALAELVHLPAYEQLRILNEQKNPRQEPQTFRIPFYAPAITAIRGYYRRDNDPRALDAARASIQQLRQPAKVTHNLRVIAAFERSAQADRSLAPQSQSRLSVGIGDTQVRLLFDLAAREGSSELRVFYNCRVAPIDPEIARTSIELAHWALEGSGHHLPIGKIEFVCFASQRAHRTNRRRPSTITRARQNVRLIERLWDEL